MKDSAAFSEVTRLNNLEKENLALLDSLTSEIDPNASSDAQSNIIINSKHKTKTSCEEKDKSDINFKRIFLILSFLPLIFFIYSNYKFVNRIVPYHTVIFQIRQPLLLLETFRQKCRAWVSQNNESVVSILKREECIWAKFWRSVTNLTASDICIVISNVFPSIVKDNFDLFPSYFYSLSHINQFDPMFFINESKLDWPDESYQRMMPSDWSFRKKRPPIGLMYIQHEIWKRQHPKSCENVNFCFLRNRRTGLGSAIHTYAMEMSYCLNQPNTVFDYHPTDQEIWASGEYCGSQKNLNCFFEPLTSCRIQANDTERMKQSISRERKHGFTMPSFVSSILQKIPIPNEYHEWYYDIAAVTYLMRLNTRTFDWLNGYEHQTLVNPQESYDIGIHVRHGDKGIEMPLLKAKSFMPAVDIIQKVTGKPKNAITVFLSTEDPEVINWFVSHSNCSVSYINYPRTNPHRRELLSGGSSLTLISLANLRISLRTSIRAETFASNWNRLVAELLCSYGQRGDALIFEMGVMRSLSAEHYELMKNWNIAKKWSYLPPKGAVYEPDDP